MFALGKLRAAQAALLPRLKPISRMAVPNAKSSSVGWHYRSPRPNIPKQQLYLAEGIMGLMWYWILFHCWYDSGHLFGHFAYPDPSKWTDKELGIPPDSED